MKKKMLIYAHYYYPDVASTGQILQDQAEGMSDEYDVTVICTVPSYTGMVDERYKEWKIYKEDLNGVRIFRVPVSEFSKSKKISRIKNILIYLFNACKVTKMVGNQDYIFTISQPPIIGGLLGVYGKKIIQTVNGKSPKLIYCIQDFNPEQIKATGYIKLKWLIRFAMYLDKWTCRNSDLIITVGRDLVDTLKRRFRNEKTPCYAMINNWIDEKQIYPLSKDDFGVMNFKEKYGLVNKFVFMYSGNIGLYYDLEGLMEVIKNFRCAKTSTGKKVVFAFVGSGSILDKLIEYKNVNQLDNVVFIPYQSKENLIYSLNSADVHWCVNARGIKGVSCPSKFYGIIGVGKPVLGVLEKGSEVQLLIDDIGCGRVAEPGDYAMVSGHIQYFIEHAESDELIEMGKRGYEYLIKKLTKDISISKYKKVIGDI